MIFRFPSSLPGYLQQGGFEHGLDSILSRSVDTSFEGPGQCSPGSNSHAADLTLRAPGRRRSRKQC